MNVSAQDTFCLRNNIKLTKSWDRIYSTLHLEHRTQDCWFVRTYAGYKFAPWLKGDVAYEFRQKYSSELRQRGIVSFTGTLKSGNFSASLRERYVMEFSKKGGESTFGFSKNVLRSRLKVKYAIPGSIFAPYLSSEIFVWKEWEKSRYYAGTELKLGARGKLDIFYLYTVYAAHPGTPRHSIGINYELSL